MGRVIRIGTRDSQLALWQAKLVESMLQEAGHDTSLVLIKSEGDIDLSTPLYEIGVQGIFTKALDISLLKEEIDVAVHSMKDVPTRLANGIIKAAVLPRGNNKDVLIPKGDSSFMNEASSKSIIATSSLRRKAQWLHRYPHHEICNLRGNVNTRLRKLSESDWKGAVFAAAGLERVNLLPPNAVELSWMLSAPAQGAIIAVCRKNDAYIIEACRHLNDEATDLCTGAERDFLRELQGGCSTPIAAFSEIIDGVVHFKGNLLTVDGSLKEEISLTAVKEKAHDIGKVAAQKVMESSIGIKILNTLKESGGGH